MDAGGKSFVIGQYDLEWGLSSFDLVLLEMILSNERSVEMSFTSVKRLLIKDNSSFLRV